MRARMPVKGFTHESTYNESKEWYTPRGIFDALGLEFDLDPCSPGAEIVPWIPAKRHLTYLDNGLIAHWEGRVFMNPPYGMDTPEWFKHFVLAYEAGCCDGIALVFARTDTRWFHNYIRSADAICFVQGRISFVRAKDEEKDIDYPALYAQGKYEPKGGCGAASMLVAFGEECAEKLFKSRLGLALPVSKPVGDGRDGERFAGDTLAIDRLPPADNENLPQNAESGQGNLFRR